MFKQHFLLGLLLAASLSAFGQSWNFQSVNAQGMGYVTGLIAHPNPALVPNFLIARTDVGGIYKLDYGTNTWQPLLDPHLSRDNNGPIQNVESVGLDPENASVFYISLNGRGYYPDPGEGDIWKTLDGGQTWESTDFLATNSMIEGNGEWRGAAEKFGIDPNQTSRIFYGTRTNGLWRKIGAANWAQISGGLPTTFTQSTQNYPGFTFVLFDKNSSSGGFSQTIYAGLWESGVWRSLDGGANWTNIGGAMKPTRGLLTPTGQLLVTSAGGGIQKWTGSAWTNITPAGQSAEDFMGIDQHPTLPNTLLANTFNRKLFRSINGGTSWSELTMNFPAGSFPPYYNTYSPFYNWTFSPFDWGSTAVQFDRNNASRVWMSNGYGVIKTDNLGSGTTSNWQAVMQNLEEIVTLDLCIPPLVGGADLVASTMDMVGWRFANRTQIPSATIADFDFVASGSCLDYCQNQPQNVCYVGVDQTDLNVKYAGRSTNNGQTFTNFNDQSPGVSGNIAMSATDPLNMVWTPADGAQPVFTLDGGNSWSNCVGISPSWLNLGRNWYSRNLIADRVNGQFFYFIDQNKIYKSSDKGATWQLKNSTLPSWQLYLNMVANPWQTDEIWVAYPRTEDTITTTFRKLFHSTNGGTTFSEITTMDWANFVAVGKGALPNQPFIFIHGRANGDAKDGIYKSENAGQTWQLVSDPNINQFSNITSLEADQRTANLVYVGTGGRGIYWAQGAPTLPVEWLENLSGAPNSKGILLDWATALEVETDHFEVEKSADGRNFSFEKIGIRAAKGTSQTANHYSFLDKKPFAGQNFYRLRQMDRDGKSTFSNVISVEWKTENASISIFPNPTEGVFYLKNEKNEPIDFEQIFIKNALGQTVRTFNFEQKMSLDGLSSGAFWVVVFLKKSDATPLIFEIQKK
jgi:xyloglucan-specific exo-beta-1,4-glucanase